MDIESTETIDWTLALTIASKGLIGNTTQIASTSAHTEPETKICNQLQLALSEQTFLAF